LFLINPENVFSTWSMDRETRWYKQRKLLVFINNQLPPSLVSWFLLTSRD
jgi:hypothetical protein